VKFGRTSITVLVSVEAERGLETHHVTEAEVVYVGVGPNDAGAEADAAAARLAAPGRSARGRMAFTDNHLYFDDVAVGQAWESPGRTVTETDVVNFAGLSGTSTRSTWTTRSPARRRSAGRSPTACCHVDRLGIGNDQPADADGGVPRHPGLAAQGGGVPGDTIRVRTAVVDKKLRGRGKRGEVVWRRTVVNQDGKVVQEGTTVTLVECRLAPRGESAERPPRRRVGLNR